MKKAGAEAEVSEDLGSIIDVFERENPNFVAELDLLGMQVDEYARILAEGDSEIVTSSNTVRRP